MPEKEAVVNEKEFAQKALALDPDLAEAHCPSPPHSPALLIGGTPRKNSTAPSN